MTTEPPKAAEPTKAEFGLGLASLVVGVITAIAVVPTGIYFPIAAGILIVSWFPFASIAAILGIIGRRCALGIAGLTLGILAVVEVVGTAGYVSWQHRTQVRADTERAQALQKVKALELQIVTAAANTAQAEKEKAQADRERAELALEPSRIREREARLLADAKKSAELTAEALREKAKLDAEAVKTKALLEAEAKVEAERSLAEAKAKAAEAQKAVLEAEIRLAEARYNDKETKRLAAKGMEAENRAKLAGAALLVYQAREAKARATDIYTSSKAQTELDKALENYRALGGEELGPPNSMFLLKSGELVNVISYARADDKYEIVTCAGKHITIKAGDVASIKSYK